MRIGLGRGLSVFVVAAIAASLMLVGSGASAASSTVVLRTSLSGANVFPGPGDPDGSGKAILLVRPSKGQICFRLAVRKIGDAGGAHIHPGEAGTANPPIIALIPPDPTSHGCINDLDTGVLTQIVENPSAYYVNVHTPDFPGGAVRGQLGDDV